MTEPEKMHFTHVGHTMEEKLFSDDGSHLRVRDIKWKEEKIWSNRQVIILAFVSLLAGAVSCALFITGLWIGSGTLLKSNALEQMTTIKIPISEIDRGAIVVGRANEPRTIEQKRKKR